MSTSVRPGFSAAAGSTMWSCGNAAVTAAPFTRTPFTLAAPGAKSRTSGCDASDSAKRAVIVPVIGACCSRGMASASS